MTVLAFKEHHHDLVNSKITTKWSEPKVIVKVSTDGRNYRLDDGSVVNAERLKRFYHKFDDMVITDGKLIPKPDDATDEETAPTPEKTANDEETARRGRPQRKKRPQRTASADDARSRGSSQHQMTLRPRKVPGS